MKLKKISLFVCLVLSLFIVTGCGKEEKTTSTGTGTTKDVSSSNDSIDSSGSGKLSCTRSATISGSGSADFTYTINYKNGIINNLHSIEKVNSTDSSTLDTYEDAYKKIAVNYNGLDNYKITINREDGSVTYDSYINYDKLDMDKLLEIEGSEDNVVEDGKVKLSTWLSFAEKFGTECEEVE